RSIRPAARELTASRGLADRTAGSTADGAVGAHRDARQGSCDRTTAPAAPACHPTGGHRDARRRRSLGIVAGARFLLRPLWLLSHLLVLALVVTMVNLGFWQLDRLDQRRDRNAVIEARQELPSVPVGEL